MRTAARQTLIMSSEMHDHSKKALIMIMRLCAQEEGRDFTGIYNECAAILRLEIDYIAEGRNANRCTHLQLHACSSYASHTHCVSQFPATTVPEFAAFGKPQ